MTTEEHDALDWLDSMCGMHTAPKDWRPFARTIKSMLARPIMPEKPPDGALRAMLEASAAASGFPKMFGWEAIYRALHAHLAAPQTKTMWNVGWLSPLGVPGGGGCAMWTIDEAMAEARRQAEKGREVTISSREVPAP